MNCLSWYHCAWQFFRASFSLRQLNTIKRLFALQQLSNALTSATHFNFLAMSLMIFGIITSDSTFRRWRSSGSPKIWIIIAFWKSEQVCNTALAVFGYWKLWNERVYRIHEFRYYYVANTPFNIRVCEQNSEFRDLSIKEKFFKIVISKISNTHYVFVR